MRTSTVVLVALAASLLPAAASSGPDWGAIRTAVEAYKEYPSSENAAAAVAVIPPQHVDYAQYSEQPILAEAVYTTLPVLARQVLALDEQAIRLAFRLQSLADGAVVGELGEMLGYLIRPHPKVFLQQLAHRLREDPKAFLPCSPHGSELVDRLPAQCRERDLRISSLESVTDSELRSVRDQCVSALKSGPSYCD